MFFSLKHIRNPEKAVEIILTALESMEFTSCSLLDQSGKCLQKLAIDWFLLSCYFDLFFENGVNLQTIHVVEG